MLKQCGSLKSFLVKDKNPYILHSICYGNWSGDTWSKGINSYGADQVLLEYRKLSNISHTQSPYINVSRLVLQLSLSNPLKPGVKLRMKM